MKNMILAFAVLSITQGFVGTSFAKEPPKDAWKYPLVCEVFEYNNGGVGHEFDFHARLPGINIEGFNDSIGDGPRAMNLSENRATGYCENKNDTMICKYSGSSLKGELNLDLTTIHKKNVGSGVTPGGWNEYFYTGEQHLARDTILLGKFDSKNPVKCKIRHRF